MVGGAVVVLTGPPGAGKTTVARLVADTFPLAVHLHGDDFWDAIRRGWVPPYDQASQRQNEVVVAAVAAAAAIYAAGSYTVVVDGIVGPWFVDVFVRAADERGVPLHYVVLRPDEATALARATGRTQPGALVDEEPIRLLHAQLADLGVLEAHAVDTTRQTPQETAEVVRGLLDAGTHLLPAR